MAVQRLSSLRWHAAHLPQPIHGSASMRWPTLTPLASRPDGDHLADVLVAERYRQLHAALFHAQAVAAAEIEIAVGQMQVAVADAGGQNLQQDFGALRLRRRLLVEPQRLAADADLEHAHVVSLPAFFLPQETIPGAARHGEPPADAFRNCNMPKNQPPPLAKTYQDRR